MALQLMTVPVSSQVKMASSDSSMIAASTAAAAESADASCRDPPLASIPGPRSRWQEW